MIHMHVTYTNQYKAFHLASVFNIQNFQAKFASEADNYKNCCG